MDRHDGYIFLIQGTFLSSHLDSMPDNCSSKREACIQAAKLKRMAEDFQNKFVSVTIDRILGAGKLDKKLTKQMGTARRALREQSKKVTDLFIKLMEEDFYANWAKGSTSSRRKFRAGARDATRRLEQKMYEAARDYHQRVTGMVQERAKVFEENIARGRALPESKKRSPK